jgi:hypothetical protein
MNNKTKKSQLVFDMKLVRKLLKMNGEIKFCPFCGKSVDEGCGCHKNIVIDVKPKRETENETIAVFQNNAAFQADYNQMIEETKAKKEDKTEIEIECDVDVEVEFDLY